MSAKGQTETEGHASEPSNNNIVFSRQLQFCSYIVLDIYGSIVT